MRRRRFLIGALAGLLLAPRAAVAQRDVERRRLEERAQERREQRRDSEERAEERRDRRRRSEEKADERHDELRDERLNQVPVPPHPPTRPLDQPIPPPQ